MELQRISNPISQNAESRSSHSYLRAIDYLWKIVECGITKFEKITDSNCPKVRDGQSLIPRMKMGCTSL